jgi:glycosyltransferase involved in cell wall biosynthesis
LGGVRQKASCGRVKLLFAIKSLAGSGGGAERVLADVASELARRGHAVTVVSFDTVDADFYPFESKVKRARLGIGRSDRPSGPLEILRRVRAIRTFATRARPDVAVGFMHSIYLPLGFSLAGTGIPVVASEHIVFQHYRTVPFQQLLVRLTPLLADRMVVVSEFARRSFPAAMQALMAIIPNPVAIPTPREREGAGHRLVLNVGRLEKQKNQRTLVAAFAALAPDYPDWRLRIVGEGPERPALERQVERLGLASRVELPGVRRDIAAEYAAADIFVMPSIYESFGLATAEALAFRVPAVGFADCPGTNELIQDGRNGILVGGPDAVHALAEGLSRLMDSAPLRAQLGQAGPDSVRRFSLAAVADRWEEVLRTVAAR